VRNFGHFPKVEIERFLNLSDRSIPEQIPNLNPSQSPIDPA